MNTNEASQDKVEKPHANFKTPHEVIADPALSKRAGAAQASTALGNPPPGSDKEIAQEIDMEKLDP
jgi:hypothetical protein